MESEIQILCNYCCMRLLWLAWPFLLQLSQPSFFLYTVSLFFINIFLSLMSKKVYKVKKKKKSQKSKVEKLNLFSNPKIKIKSGFVFVNFLISVINLLYQQNLDPKLIFTQTLLFFFQ